ncbi:MAG: hypothetical protein CW716_07620 [Candidatus Bathyarchaeum sp.]|nr:MAG: hypothetical protein CW716_07620 [Candidatus Bathyarchaeum sp.]
MTMWFYVKTDDSPKRVGELVCDFNVFEDEHPKGKYSWVMDEGKGDEEYWQIRSKYEGLKEELTNVAIVYRVGDVVVVGEVENSFVPNLLDPLFRQYGFDSIKWIVSDPRK